MTANNSYSWITRARAQDKLRTHTLIPQPVFIEPKLDGTHDEHITLVKKPIVREKENTFGIRNLTGDMTRRQILGLGAAGIAAVVAPPALQFMDSKRRQHYEELQDTPVVFDLTKEYTLGLLDKIDSCQFTHPAQKRMYTEIKACIDNPTHENIEKLKSLVQTNEILSQSGVEDQFLVAKPVAKAIAYILLKDLPDFSNMSRYKCEEWRAQNKDFLKGKKAMVSSIVEEIPFPPIQIAYPILSPVSTRAVNEGKSGKAYDKNIADVMQMGFCLPCDGSEKVIVPANTISSSGRFVAEGENEGWALGQKHAKKLERQQKASFATINQAVVNTAESSGRWK